MNRVHLACDHAGFALKNELAAHLKEKGFEVRDHGARDAQRCDYPVYANAVCKAVLEEGGQGLLICGTGIGMSMAANRYGGIRAAVCACEFQARAAREHNNANVLCLGARVIGPDLAVSIVDVFMSTAFTGGRHIARIEQFDAVTHPLK
jgi:ribose 5-phosphate isomerase B